MAKGGFYAVAAGRATGVFSTWTECKAQVNGFSGCKYKKCKTRAEAQAFVSDLMDQRDVVGCDSNRNRKRRRDETLDVEPPVALRLRRDTNGTSDIVEEGLKTGIVTSKEEEVDKMKLDSGDKMKLESKQAALSFLDTFDDDQSSVSLITRLKEDEKSREQKSSDNVDVILNSAARKAFAEAHATTSSTKLPSRKQVVMQPTAATKCQENDEDPKDPTTLVAFCDGSARNNGRQKCRAGYACIFPHCEEWNVAKQLVEERATNNRAEYMAALEAMKRANVEDPDRSRLLYIFSDSMLLIRSMTEWVSTWQKNNWRKSNGKPVQNRDLLELLVAEKGDRCIRWNHVKAHTGKKDWGSKWNDVADHAARNAASSVGTV